MRIVMRKTQTKPYMLYVPMHTAAFQTEDVAKAHRSPIRILHATITALAVARQSLDDRPVFGAHLHHGVVLADVVGTSD